LNLVMVSRHLGLLWVAVEATTLASAPLIYFHRHHRSLEAAWKYLMICSVGIAVALLGTFFLELAEASGGDIRHTWLQAAFICVLVGYGTKMGLAPLHTWLPDAHGEAPSLVSALLSGALLNGAFLGILRVGAVCAEAGLGDFVRELLLLFGLVSLGVAAVFILGQRDTKRLLAYSSVEHMGILALGTGLGAGTAVPLHALGHSLAKGALFLLSGNLLHAYRTKETGLIRGIAHRLPVTGRLWTAGILAALGVPPFATFASEFMILRAALAAERWYVAAGFLILLAAVFTGMLGLLVRMVYDVPDQAPPRMAEPAWSVLPALLLLAGCLLLGLWLPNAPGSLLAEAARLLPGTAP
jgi:hydrogenase-4 component F